MICISITCTQAISEIKYYKKLFKEKIIKFKKSIILKKKRLFRSIVETEMYTAVLTIKIKFWTCEDQS